MRFGAIFCRVLLRKSAVPAAHLFRDCPPGASLLCLLAGGVSRAQAFARYRKALATDLCQLLHDPAREAY